MPIEAGQKFPHTQLMKRLEDKTNQKVDLGALLDGRRVAIVGMPGAFTATCTGDHIPGLIRALPDIQAKGVDEVVVFAVNDPQVIRAWGEVTGATQAGITMLADPLSELTEALGLRFDNPDAGLLGRCTRFAAIVQNGVVETLLFEEGYLGCELTSGDGILSAIT